jgi:hypothetical protein
MGMNKPDAYWGWTEPESAANTDYQPVYPYNNVTQTRSGHMFELDEMFAAMKKAKKTPPEWAMFKYVDGTTKRNSKSQYMQILGSTKVPAKVEQICSISEVI